ncbi:MAG: rRNA maturation RNase YbeY [Candidatus Levybacteria bacterium RIFCSPHIGHO2_12_FULL_38_12]|nr:MAG: rRNA maturation RNase YbeY [Candidatus Levybacteria bacterium RIFCSPHIGHO2_01_FULL_38_12]OGH22134.1 MAG: rRNA maturation RNase YbeY [Candidatus Levybacteria bacterium RIFCSPHIGHO2_02_FULL_37_18]OGH22981.1 MAG: rRNA maturation RNase YbeY [Candidatus Levybacteria bacterium RIFCSPHIGHO2_12_FULL_38_12]OGH34152.1 MAG: rRNA maturation RNase YbeY [Candidatus Levybacteria bacterium RIFCSPLOWO2_01_FULL_37_20]OGH44945.1 MAG: rRNA maturation RNase YbeY [Candidatus Levybacteria bacterium RIFCSPLOWO
MSEEISVFIFVESRYKVNRKRIRTTVVSELKKHGLSDQSEVSVAFVGNRKMRQINKKYRDIDKTTNILSFSLTEGEPVVLPPHREGGLKILRLGDIVLSYPELIKEAAEDEMLVDDKIDELLVHGLSHLLGIHH